MSKKDNAHKDNIVGLLGKGTDFDGKLVFQGTLRIDGKFKGEIITKGVLVVGEGSLVHAEVNAETIVVHGEIHGNLCATKKIEIRGKGKVFGNIKTVGLIVEEGVTFEGSCQMKDSVNSEVVSLEERKK
ncbi:MAG: polymer-forming cytoskeletal protein [Thermodesulfobacteriota bacterium]|nr:polymer-forming cytoskeletal protein [Thermodesulfobacteriota bacterium]